MKNITLALNWLVLSSKDSEKLSKTVTGSLIFVVASTIATALGVDGVKEMTDSVVNFVVVAGQLVSAGYAVYGAVVKVKRTVGGTNAVLNDPQL